MPRYASDPTGTGELVYEPPPDVRRAEKTETTVDIASWLRERVPMLVVSWSENLSNRSAAQGAALDDLVGRFAERLVRMLPLMLGPRRDAVGSLWMRTAELYGRVAARRGLAAGEVIEEIHALRELVIRTLYRDPPAGGEVPLSLREVLRLNRALDAAVTHASVGHTDALFFQFFERDQDTPPLPPDSVAEEASLQLEAINSELLEALGAAALGPAEELREN